MAEIVFQNPRSRKILNGIVHPFVLKFLRQEISNARLRANKSLIFVEAALIFEAHAEKLFDFIIVVNAESEQLISRVMKRDNINREAVLQRINSQMLSKEKDVGADFVIHNNTDKASLEQNCRFLFQLLSKIANSR